MEQLSYRLKGGHRVATAAPCFVGVLASGNLEVLVEPEPDDDSCVIDVVTPATGFADVWEAVVRAFFERHPVANLRISVNDNGATPATVSLRLDQAIEEYLAAARRAGVA
jgi:malonate decarboxylase delta subunit